MCVCLAPLCATTKEIQSSELGKSYGDATGLSLIHFDVKMAAEAVNSPRLRIAPFQEQWYARTVRSVLDGRSVVADSPGALNCGDCVLLIDGGRSGNLKGLKKPWHAGDCKSQADDRDDDDCEDGVLPDSKVFVSTVNVLLDEKSLREKRKIVRGTNSLRQLEGMHVLTHGALTLPERDGKHYAGTNKGSVIGPVVLPDGNEEWTMSVKDLL